MTFLAEESTTPPIQATGYRQCGGFSPAFKN
jgi:hypothetical protein